MKIRLLLTLILAACVALLAGSAQAQVVRNTQTFKTAAGDIKFTPIYHPSTLIQFDGKNVYLDPYSQGDMSGLPPADLILITHNHGDHLDKRAIGIVSTPQTEIWGPAILVQDLPHIKVITNGETKTWDGGKLTVEAMPMYNIKNGNRHVKGAFNAYIITYGGMRIYFSGDTEAIPEMRALKNIDLAFVCMNDATMSAAEAADGVKAFHPKVVIPYHYRNSDLNLFAKLLEGTGVEVRIIDYYPWYAQPQPPGPGAPNAPPARVYGGTPQVGLPPPATPGGGGGAPAGAGGGGRGPATAQ